MLNEARDFMAESDALYAIMKDLGDDDFAAPTDDGVRKSMVWLRGPTLDDEGDLCCDFACYLPPTGR